MPPRLVEEISMELFPMHGRSKGRHVSEAIYAIMKDLYPERFDDTPIDMNRANLGNALERAIIDGLVEAYPGRYEKPGQLELDNTFGTPDLWDVYEWTCLEFKLTWASMRRADDMEDVWWWRYWVQLKAYCHMAGQTKGRLCIAFVNGDYSRGDTGGPRILCFENEWTVDELQENWEMLQRRLDEIYAPKSPRRKGVR